jgi:hypothetical protein
MVYTSIRVLLIASLLQSCNRNGLEENVPLVLDSLVNAFHNEAAKRGLNLERDRSALKIEFGRLAGRNSGSCRPDSYPKIITLDSITWKHINSRQKESLLFHELAHCLLTRSHCNETFGFGECKSWMRESEKTCSINLQNSAWREYYLDELFTSTQSMPYWYEHDFPFYENENLGKAKNVKIKPMVHQSLDSIFSDPCRDWVAKIRCEKPQSKNSWLGLNINEIIIEASFIKSNPYSNNDDFVPRIVIMNTNPKKIVVESNDASRGIDVSLQKLGNTLSIYFGRRLKYRMPVNEEPLKIGGYCLVPENKYSFDIYFL